MNVNLVSAQELANVLTDTKYSDLALIIDTRSLLEYNETHIQGAVNVCCSKLMKRRLQNGQMTIHELLASLNCDWNGYKQILVYDQTTWDILSMTESHFFFVLVAKLVESFPLVAVLQGGFNEFSYKFPKLCDTKRKTGCPLLSISTPCASATNCPPTKVLPFLYLGSEKDAQSEDILRTCHVKYVLNASQSAVDTPYCSMGHYLRIPIQDSSSENIVTWFQTAFDFIDKVKESDDHVLLHCVGGVSRSATIAIAYVMKHLSLSLDNAYRYVKEKRPTISPNLNFMGQLLQYEQELLKETELICTPLSELKLEGLKSPTTEFPIRNFSFHTDNQNLGDLCGAFPSPDSDNITPSTNSDAIPSPDLDDIPSPDLDNLSLPSGFCTNMPSPNSDDLPSPANSDSSSSSLSKPFTLDINFTKKNSQKSPSRTFSLQLDVERR